MASDALLYAWLHRGTEGDLAFYREQCRGATRVLELGCGYGRVLAALAADGHRPLGLDRDAELLALAPPEAGARVRGDMRRFAFAARFDRILLPHSAVYCLLDEEECRACLRGVAEHLAPGGRLLLDAYAADAFHASGDDAEHDPDALERIAEVGPEAERYAVFERFAWQRARQRLDVHYEYVPVAGGSSRGAAIPQRYWLRDQLAPLLDAAGLRLSSLWADFAGADFGREDRSLVAIAEKR